MKTLVVYYSRTGNTKKVGNAIAKKMKADQEELFDTIKRSGILGWIIAGRDGMRRSLTKLKRPEKDPGDYDLVVIGTPVWVSIAPPVRTYLTAFKGKLKKVAFFCTMNSSGDEKVFREMSEVIDGEPIDTLTVLAKEVGDEDFSDKIKNFVRNIK